MNRPSLAFVVVALLAGCGTSLQPRVATVDGRAVEVASAGSAGITVVFESGLGDDWRPWDGVASEVSKHARVFAYSRPGYGQSDATDRPRDGAHIVEELHRLLAAEGISPPYVLVGHSTGAAYMELFAKTHPDEVRGLVTVDGRPAGFLAACETQRLPMCGIPDDTLAKQPQVMIDEYRGFAMIAGELAAAGPFGAYPVRVLTAEKETSPRQMLWESMQAAIASEAADGTQTIFKGSSHYLQIDRTREVVQVIDELLQAR